MYYVLADKFLAKARDVSLGVESLLTRPVVAVTSNIFTSSEEQVNPFLK